MRRELRNVRTEKVYGVLVVEGDRATYDQATGDVLAGLRRQVGDEEAARMVMRDGWSNGYLYFADPTP